MLQKLETLTFFGKAQYGLLITDYWYNLFWFSRRQSQRCKKQRD